VRTISDRMSTLQTRNASAISYEYREQAQPRVFQTMAQTFDARWQPHPRPSRSYCYSAIHPSIHPFIHSFNQSIRSFNAD